MAHLTTPVVLVLSAVEKVVSNEMFEVPTENASAVKRIGKKMIEWLNNYSAHSEEADKFCTSLIATIRGCIPSTMKGAIRDRETLWQNYHELRCSEDYLSAWKAFLKEALSEDQLPLFFQSVGDQLLDQLVHQATHVKNPPDQQQQLQPISEMEMMALRYAAGYVPRSLLKKLPKSANLNKQKLLLCLWDLLDDEREGGTADSWLQAVDRGGLTRVNEMTFQVFLAMENEFRKHLHKQKSFDLEQLSMCVTHDEEVLFYWSIVGGDWEVEESEQLLKLVADMYIRIRGFSYANAWMEMFKSANDKTLQKSKGLRKKLNS